MEWWLRLRPHDLLFFRGPQPFTAGDTGYLRSEFPPTPQVIQGAVRTGLLQANGISIAEYTGGRVADATKQGVLAAVGPAGQQEEMGLDLRGPFLEVSGRVYLPAPLDLYTSTEQVIRTAPQDTPTVSDLGTVRLPAPPPVEAQPTAGKWLSSAGTAAYLSGGRVAEGELYDPFETQAAGRNVRSRAAYEPKVGLALDPTTRTARQGMLYTIAPLRFGEDMALAVHVSGVPEGAAFPSALPLGGEGRFVSVDRGPTLDLTQHREAVTSAVDRSHRFRLLFLQPALFDGGWLPPGFQRTRRNGADVWEGQLNGVSCRLVSACLDRPRKVGGWDLRLNQPKPVRSLVPAGSVYYFETDSPGAAVVESLDDRKIGQWSRIGFGHCLVGEWT